jgi:iron complex transport system substrate-binding protein
MRKLCIAIATIGLAAAMVSCSDDDQADAETSATTSAAVVAADSPDAATTDAATTDAATADAATTDTATTADAFPVTITHKFGDITIPSEPQRIVSIGFSDQDWLLALGVTPIAVRDWYGDQPFATWPWAQDELGDAEPTVLASTDLNFEEIAALDPDLIVGVYSGITESEYATLSEIAPTLAQPGDYVDYGTPWDVMTEMIGRAVGKNSEAAAVIEHVNGLYDAARAAHPEFKGPTAAVTFYFDGAPGAYASQDGRSRIISDLGFTIPKKFDELAGDNFFFSVSNEEISVLDTDVVIWIVGDPAAIDAVKGIALRPSMRAFKEGRELLTSIEVSGAFSFGSPLSIEYALQELVPELALAVDGDPATPVPSAEALAVPAS